MIKIREAIGTHGPSAQFSGCETVEEENIGDIGVAVMNCLR
jgi:hypothetical protein